MCWWLRVLWGWVGLPVAALLSYVLVLLVYSLYYSAYIVYGGRTGLSALIVVALLSLYLSIRLLHAAFTAVEESAFVLVSAVLLLAGLVLVEVVGGWRGGGVRVVGGASIDGVECLVYEGGFDVFFRGGRVYVSRWLAERLTPGELRALVHHERMHGRRWWLLTLTALLYGLWLFVTAVIVSVLLSLWRLDVGAVDAVESVVVLYTASAVATLALLVPLWMAEHEADYEALRAAGLEAVVGLLVKVHVYQALWSRGLHRVVRDCSVGLWEHDWGGWAGLGGLRLLALVALTLAVHSLMHPRDVWSYLLQSRWRVKPRTHPPLWLRLLLLQRRARSAR